MSIALKSADDLIHMRAAGRDTAKVLDFITPFVVPGVSTNKLDQLCHEFMVDELKVIPAPLHYQPPGYTPYPKSICTSVNHQVCHGIPSDRVLKEGDVLNIDITVIKAGWHGDASRMYAVGKVATAAQRLCQVTQECLWKGILQVKPGAKLATIGLVIENHAKQFGYSIVKEYCGHGIGREFHEDPQVVHYFQRGASLELQPGMVFTIEPMINAGKPDIREMPDGWTIVTRDHSLSAQWEHTVAVTESGVEVLTRSADFPEPPLD